MSDETTSVRLKIDTLLAGKYTPQNLNNGPSNLINQDLVSLFLNQYFTDSQVTDRLEKAIDDYLSGKALTILGPNFKNEESYRSVVSHWMLESIKSDLESPANRGLFELLLLVQYSDKKINYITYDSDEFIILKTIEPVRNIKIDEYIGQIIGKAIKENNVQNLFVNTYLADLIETYNYEQFKRKISDNIANGLRSGRVGAQIQLSDEFLGFNGGDGPLKFVEESGKVRLNKDFSSLRSNGATASQPYIPADKLELFKEKTKWETKVNQLKKTGATSDDGFQYTDEQIFTLADSIEGTDLTKNPFDFYTGEVYDEWGQLFDGGFWMEFGTEVGEVNNLVKGALISTFFEDEEQPEGDYDVLTTRFWRGSLIKDFQAEDDSPFLPDIDEATVAFLLATPPAVITTKVGVTALAAERMKIIVQTYRASKGFTGTTQLKNFSKISRAFNIATKATKVPRATGALVKAARFLNVAATAEAALIAVNLAIFAGFGYAMWKAEETSQTERLEKLVLSKYNDFVYKAIVSFGEGNKVADAFRSAADELSFLNHVLQIFGVDQEVKRRVKLFNLFSFELSKDDNFLDPSNENNILAAMGASITRGFANIDLPEITDLNAEQIQDRQRFYKQCALMMNMAKFAPVYEQHVIDRQGELSLADGPIRGKPYGGRFWRATSINKEKLINNLFSSAESQELFEIPAHVMTQLTPRFKLYKVLNDKSGKLKRTEFIFPMHTDLTRKKNFTTKQSIRPETKVEQKVQSFLDANFDKGDGVGLKSFTLDFNGTNPAEARNDVKGSMTLFFQSFADFVRERVDNNGNKFSFVDLIVQPAPDDDNGKTVQGVARHSNRQYDASFYRIMVEIGYNVPEKLEGYDGGLTKVQNAIKNMNKSFYLCMIDHSFNIKNDGTVEVSLTYRAYIETALKSLRFDALTTPELAKQREDNETKMAEMTEAGCTDQQLEDLKVLISALEEQIVKNSLNSIMKRLHKRGRIFTCEIDPNDRRQFLTNGFFRKCDIISGVRLDEGASGETGDLGIVLNTRLPDKSTGFDFNDSDKNDTLVQFFFFGDLLYTILDALYIEEGKKLARGLKNTMIVLGSFYFKVFQREQVIGETSFNISQIPISVEFFSRWFVDNVINQKSTRRSFPILNFIRSLTNALTSNALLESCVNREVDDRLMFQTSQISSYSATGTDVVGSLISNLPGMAILNTDYWRIMKFLPLEGSPQGDSKIENFFHYIVLNANGSTKSHKGTGNYNEDIGSGVFHMEIGSNRGMVKNISFSKTDLQFVREARFMRNGIDGLQQLSSVYSVSIDMFGNTLFYPGMDLWLNPYGFGGTALGNPRDGKDGKRSLANTLGLGGYHTITGVSTNLTPQAFSTSIKAQHYYSGDKKPINPVGKLSNPKDKSIEETTGEPSEDVKKFCDSEIVRIQNLGRDGGIDLASIGMGIETPETESTATGDSGSETAAEAVPETPTGEIFDKYIDSLVSAIEITEGEWKNRLEKRGNLDGFYVVGSSLENITNMTVSESNKEKVYFVPVISESTWTGGIVKKFGQPFKVSS